MSIEEYRKNRKGNKKINNQNKKTINKYISSFISRFLITTIFFLAALIITKNNAELKDFMNKHIYTSTFKFTEVKKLYNKYFGKYLGEKETTTSVFTEKLNYKEANIYKDGVKLTVEKNYLVPALESGIVIFIGEKEGYGNTLIIEQIDGIDVWYSNINIKDIKMYDYIEKGSLIGESIDTNLYLIFQKDGNFLSYKKYI